MAVRIEFVLPDDILAELLAFSRLSEAEQDDILAAIYGHGNNGGSTIMTDEKDRGES